MQRPPLVAPAPYKTDNSYIAIAAIVGSRLQRWVDGGEIRELRAGKDGEIAGLKERFNLAHDKQERLKSTKASKK
jgi:hypothetical protein